MRYLISFCAILLHTTVFSQQQYITIGEKIPSVNLSLLNYKTETENIYKFLGKTILIDFWSPSCAPCVKSFPKVDLLQKKYAKDLVVLFVAQESKEKIQSFLRSLYNVKQISPITVYADTLLNQFFPHESIPFYIWINKEGVVRNISNKDDITDLNVQQIIKDSNFSASRSTNPKTETKTKALDSNFLRSALASSGAYELGQRIEADSTILGMRYLTDFMPGYRGVFCITKKGVYLSNAAIPALYAIAYGEGSEFFGGWSHIKIITEDSTKFFDFSSKRQDQTYKEIWRTIPGHEYNYILKVPLSDSTKKWEFMRTDLSLHFPYIKAYKDSIERNVLELITTNNSLLYKSRDTGNVTLDHTPFFIKCNKLPMHFFVRALELEYQDFAILDKTNFNGKVDIDLEADLSNIAEVNKILNKYGLSLKQTKAKVVGVVIEDHRVLSSQGINDHVMLE